MRPVLAGILGAVIAHLLIGWLGRRFPIGPKPHPMSWYSRRYEWIEWLARVLFVVGMGLGLWLYQAGYIPRNDPRGAAVGFVLGCVLSLATLMAVCAISPIHRFRDYWEFQELKYGARNVFALYLVLPVFVLAAYGTAHLLLVGP